MTITPSRFSELVGLIYDCAFDSERWLVAMDAIRLELECSNAVLGLQALRDGELILNQVLNVPEPYAARMYDYGPDVIELWGGEAVVQAMSFDEPHVISRAPGGFTDPATTTNRYVLEWARPQGLVDALSCGLAKDSYAFGSLNFGRHERYGLFGEREITIARLLIPHLQRTATITRLYDGARAAASSFEAAVATLRVPVILVTGDLRIVHRNPAAQTILDGGDILFSIHGVLHARSTGIGAALASAVLQAATDEAHMERRGFGIPVRAPDGGSAALHVMPLRRRRLDIDGAAVAAIFIAEADEPVMAPAALVAALFHLTPTEARVYECVASGMGGPRAAAYLDIKLSTIKTHLQRIFEKTGTRKQTELIMLARSLAPPIRRDESLTIL